MRALIFVYIIEEVALEWFSSTPARSRAETVKRDLLVAYLVIDICA